MTICKVPNESLLLSMATKVPLFIILYVHNYTEPPQIVSISPGKGFHHKIADLAFGRRVALMLLSLSAGTWSLSTNQRA